MLVEDVLAQLHHQPPRGQYFHTSSHLVSLGGAGRRHHPDPVPRTEARGAQRPRGVRTCGVEAHRSSLRPTAASTSSLTVNSTDPDRSPRKVHTLAVWVTVPCYEPQVTTTLPAVDLGDAEQQIPGLVPAAADLPTSRTVRRSSIAYPTLNCGLSWVTVGESFGRPGECLRGWVLRADPVGEQIRGSWGHQDSGAVVAGGDPPVGDIGEAVDHW